MNANIIPNLADIVSMFFSAEVLVPAAIVSCFIGLCAALLRFNRDGDAMEAFIKSGGDKLDFRAYAEFEKKRKVAANILIVSGMLALACMYAAFLIFYMG